MHQLDEILVRYPGKNKECAILNGIKIKPLIIFTN